jgi:tetratricopeptide (TPR) repeat protein
MKKRNVWPALIALSLFVILPPALIRGQRSAPPGKDAASLESLLAANSFLAAGELAVELLADPALAPRTQALCGLAVLKAGRVEEAARILEKAVARLPDCPEAHLGLGRIALARNDPDKAVVHLRKSVPSKTFYEEGLRYLWRTVWDRGRVDELLELGRLAEERYGMESRPLPSWIGDNLGRIKGLEGRRLYRMKGRFERLRVPLSRRGPGGRIRMIDLEINGRGDYAFHIDSALVEFMTISPLLAEELGLVPTGSATSIGVGTNSIATSFAVLDAVRLGPATFRDVPVMVSDLRTLRGLKEGLIGTALLKRFNATIDVEAGFMDLFPLERPDLLARTIDRTRVAADVPLLLFNSTAIDVSFAGEPPALCILDSAASTNLVDGPVFEARIRPKLDPSRIVRTGIQGAGGAQFVRQAEGVRIAVGGLAFDGQISEFPMAALNEIAGRYAAGLVGNPLLWPYRVHLDFKNGRLILERRKPR